MRLIIPISCAIVCDRLESAADAVGHFASRDAEGSRRPLYAFRRPYGYDMYLVPEPNSYRQQWAKVHLLDRHGFVELNVWFRTEPLWVAMIFMAISVFVTWGTYYYYGGVSYQFIGGALLAPISLVSAFRGFREVRTLRSSLSALFPEAQPAA